VIQGDLNKGEEEFHLEIKSKGGKCKGAARRRKPSNKKSKDKFLGSIFEVPTDKI
jgi:hypothetical protein